MNNPLIIKGIMERLVNGCEVKTKETTGIVSFVLKSQNCIILTSGEIINPENITSIGRPKSFVKDFADETLLKLQTALKSKQITVEKYLIEVEPLRTFANA
jgi:hypothetical protein